MKDLFTETYLNIINQGVFDFLKSNTKKGLKAYQNQEYDQAYSYFFNAAMDDENPEAMMYLGQMCDQGLGVKKNPQSAFRWYKQAADKGDIEGMYNTGLCYLNGDGTQKDIDKAIKYFKQASYKGDNDAKKKLITLKDDVKRYEQREAEKYRKEVQMYQKQYEEYRKQERYRKSQEIKNNKKIIKARKKEEFEYKTKKAYSDYEKWNKLNPSQQIYQISLLGSAAENGQPQAQFKIAQLQDRGVLKYSEDGRIVPSMELYQRSANHGCEASQCALGNYYFNQKEYTKALPYYRKAANKDNGWAEYQLGVMYEDGLGISVNEDKALKFYKRALNNKIVSGEIKRKAFNRIKNIESMRNYKDTGKIDSNFSLENEQEKIADIKENIEEKLQSNIKRKYIYTEHENNIKSRALQGDQEAQNKLGKILFKKEQYDQAAKWLIKAENQTKGRAQRKIAYNSLFYLGLIVFFGLGSQKKDEKTGGKFIVDAAYYGEDLEADMWMRKNYSLIDINNLEWNNWLIPDYEINSNIFFKYADE